MRIQVLFFAVLRERSGADGATLELARSSSVADARRAIAAAHPTLAALLPRVQAAVNRQMVPDTHTLCDGDELALIPPVAGGSGDRIAVSDRALSMDPLLAAVAAPTQGAVVTFVGHVRRHGQQPNVVRLEYEAYVPMAVEVLTAIADELEREHAGARVAIHHRIGALAVGEIAVVIAVSAPHRAEAFAACREAIERLKQRAPIWKKEIGEDGAVWIGLGP